MPVESPASAKREKHDEATAGSAGSALAPAGSTVPYVPPAAPNSPRKTSGRDRKAVVKFKAHAASGKKVEVGTRGGGGVKREHKEEKEHGTASGPGTCSD